MQNVRLDEPQAGIKTAIRTTIGDRQMKVEVKIPSCVRLFATPWTVHGIPQARVLEWVAIPFSRGFPNPGIEPQSPVLQADSLPTEPLGKPQFLRTWMYTSCHFSFL